MIASIYKYPEIFRAVHMEAPGEIEEEAGFLLKVWRKHLGRLPRRLLDIAAGNSPHGQIFARAGIEVTAIDRSPTMIAQGVRECIDLPVSFHRRAIERFRLPGRKCQAAIFMSETFPVIMDNKDVESHFQSVATMLTSGSLYCIDIDKQDLPETVTRRTLWREREVRVGRARVEIREFRHPTPWYSAVHSIYELNCRIDFGNCVEQTSDLIPIRFWTPGLLDWAARASGLFRLVKCYADYSLTLPIARCDRRWLAVLRRT